MPFDLQVTTPVFRVQTGLSVPIYSGMCCVFPPYLLSKKLSLPRIEAYTEARRRRSRAIGCFVLATCSLIRLTSLVIVRIFVDTCHVSDLIADSISGVPASPPRPSPPRFSCPNSKLISLFGWSGWLAGAPLIRTLFTQTVFSARSNSFLTAYRSMT